MDNKSINLKTKPICSIPLVLISKDPKLKIGKINDTINPEKTLLTKEPGSKQFKIIEKKSNKEEARYTGSQMADQTSKYLIFKYNQDSGRIEVSPAGDWHFFKKEINYPTMTIEEAEEKMKGKSSLLDYIRNKGVLTKTKKEKKSFGRVGAAAASRGGEEEEFEETGTAIKPEEPISEDEREEIDPDLKDIPSDIEEGFIKGKTTKEEDAKEEVIFSEDVDEAQSESDDSELFEDDEDDNTEMELSEIENHLVQAEEAKKSNNIQKDFLSIKRKGDESLYDSRPSDKKQRTNQYDLLPRLEESLLNSLSKHKRLTFAGIVKELSKLNFSRNEIENHLDSLLSKNCDKFHQGSDFFYFKKSEKNM